MAAVAQLQQRCQLLLEEEPAFRNGVARNRVEPTEMVRPPRRAKRLAVVLAGNGSGARRLIALPKQFLFERGGLFRAGEINGARELRQVFPATSARAEVV